MYFQMVNGVYGSNTPALGANAPCSRGITTHVVLYPIYNIKLEYIV